MTKKYALIVLLSFALLDAEAAIVDIVCTDWRDVPLLTDRWSFDYDLQVLTLRDSVYEIGPPLSDLFRERSVWVSGLMDSESRFTIVENITNRTGVPLTGYMIALADTIITYNVIVQCSVQATGFPEIHQEGPHRVELAWSEPIPDGESFTIQFDVLSDTISHGRLLFNMDKVAIPEPATFALLGIGTLVLLRSRERLV